ncbi:retrovirus-related pol polyprotein from transposon TNT 1-94 [Tanacetum coccineum]
MGINITGGGKSCTRYDKFELYGYGVRKKCVVTNGRLSGVNRISGEVPEYLSSLRDLEVLLGGIQVSLSNCSKLRSVLLYLNMHQDEIPSEFGRLKSEMTRSDEEYNYFQGVLPAEITSLAKLKVFNHLSGSIPSSHHAICESFDPLLMFLRYFAFQAANDGGNHTVTHNFGRNNFMGELSSVTLAPGKTRIGEHSVYAFFAGENNLNVMNSKQCLLIRIQVKDIVREVEDYLKTYSSAVMDINTNLSQHDFTTCSQLHNFTTSSQLHNFFTTSQLLHNFTTSSQLHNFFTTSLRDTKIAASRLKFNAFKSLEGEKVNGTFTRLKCLLNDLENNGVIIPKEEVNAMFVNSLPRKWLSMNQTQRSNNSIKNDSLATMYGKYNYEEDVEEDQRTNNEFIADLNAEYHERALLKNQKRFSKRSERGKYKGLKAKMAILTKRINDMTKGKSEKGKKEKEKSEKGLIAESFDWDDKSVSLDDEGSTKIMAFMAITKEEPSVGKADARSGQWVDITIKRIKGKTWLINFNSTFNKKISYIGSELSNVKNNVSINCSLQNEVIRVNLENESLKDEIIDLKKVIEKWTCSKVTLDQLLSEQVLGNIVIALGRKGRKKEKISSKEVVFTKADESSSMLSPEITSDLEFECDSQEPLLPFPKLIGVTPFGPSESLISLSDLTLNMTDLTLDTPVPKKTRPSVKVSPAYVIKKKTEKSPVVPIPCSDKKADSSTKQLLLTLIEKNHLSDDCYSNPKCSTCGSTDHLTKEHLEHAAIKKTLSKLKAQPPLKPSPKKAPMILKPFKECKYCGFNDHHSDHCEFYPGVKYVDYLKRSVWYPDGVIPSYMTKIKTKICTIFKESGPKVVFRDDSLEDTKGHGLVNCNGITFTRVAYVNGIKHNLISISQLCDANYKVLFTKTQGTIYNQNDEVVLIAPRRRDVYVIDMSSFNKESNPVSLPRPPQVKMESLNEVRVKELRCDNGTEFRNYKLE